MIQTNKPVFAIGKGSLFSTTIEEENSSSVVSHGIIAIAKVGNLRIKNQPELGFHFQ